MVIQPGEAVIPTDGAFKVKVLVDRASRDEDRFYNASFQASDGVGVSNITEISITTTQFFPRFQQPLDLARYALTLDHRYRTGVVFSETASNELFPDDEFTVEL